MGSLRDLDDKENRKDQILKPAKLRSPASSTTKSTKNFMSPTISASSKITESPRKKVLIERNEAGRTSFNSTEVKSPARKVTFADTVDYSDSKSEIGLQENDEFQPVLDGIVKEETEKLPASTVSEDFKSDEALNPKPETESLFETVTDEPDYVNLDPTFNLSPTPPPISSTSTIIAPLDADPLIPPYDPKRNYLSPRPQFLHYKPNPRVELYKERENMKLEDSFSSDTEVTEDALSDNLSEKGSDDASSNEVVSEEQHHVSEPSPITSTMQEEEVKPGFSFRSKSIIALILLLSVAFISITNTNSPVFHHTAFKDLTIVSGAYEWSEISHLARTNFDRFSELAKASFDGLNRDLHIWFTKSMSSISELISTFRGVNNLGHLQYWNLTVLQEDMEVNHFPIFGHGERIIGEAPHVDLPVLNVEENEDSADTYSDEINAGGISEEHYEEQEVQEEEQVPPMSNRHEDDATEEIDTYEESIGDISAHEEREVQQDVGVITEVESASATLSEEVALVGQSATVIESESAMSEPSQSDIGSQTSEIHTELSEAKQTPENDASLNMDLKDQPLLNSEGAEHNDEQQPDSNSEINSEVFHDVQWRKEGGKSPSFEAIIAASLLLFLSIVAGTTFKWLRKKDEGRKTVATATTITSSVEKKPFLVNFKDEQQASLDKPFLRNNGPIEMDDVLGGESYPSEMSSFENSSSYYSQKVVMKEQNEAQSVEKKPKKSSGNRRESLASSDYSVGSLSYGSFTTYEKLSSKNVSYYYFLFDFPSLLLYDFVNIVE